MADDEPKFLFKLRSSDDPGGINALTLPSNPTEFNVDSQANFTSINIDGMGEVKLPNGRSSTVYSWSSVFYGYARTVLTPLVHNWRDPIDIVAQIDNWVDQQVRLGLQARRMLNLTITNSNVNKDVWISHWSYKPVGGFGDIAYSLELTEARSIHITVGPMPGDDSGTVSSQGPTPDDGGENAPTPATYIVNQGDFLIKIAKLVYGDSSRWRDIYDANKALIGSDPGKIQVGMNLTIPGGVQTDVEPTTDELG